MECIVLPFIFLTPLAALLIGLATLNHRPTSRFGRRILGVEPRREHRHGLEAEVWRDPEGWRFTIRPSRGLAGKMTLCQAGAPLFPDIDLGPAAEVEVGDATFDAIYLIRSKPGSFAKAVLSPELIAEIRRFGRRGDIAALAGPSMIALRFAGIGEDEDGEFDRFLELGFRFARAVLALPEAAPPPPDRVASGAMSLRGSCAMCGAAFRSPPLSCSRCATPHHRDCWEFLGRCAVYACGSSDAR